MFLVHFSNYSSGGGAVGQVYQAAVRLLFETRFWAMFAILFGAGFALQLWRAEAGGARLVPFYLRRLAGLAAFGFIAHAVFGFNVLLGYALWGFALLLVRRASIRVLIAALVLSAVSGSIYALARASVLVAI